MRAALLLASKSLRKCDATARESHTLGRRAYIDSARTYARRKYVYVSHYLGGNIHFKILRRYTYVYSRVRVRVHVRVCVLAQ